MFTEIRVKQRRRINMTQGSVITDEMRKAIGVESEPTIVLIEKEPIRRFAEAIGGSAV